MKKSYIERAQNFMIRYINWCDKNDFVYNDKVTIKRYASLRSNNRIEVKFRSGCARAALITSDYCIKIEYDKKYVSKFGGNNDEIQAWNDIISESGYEYLFAKPTEFIYKDCYCIIMPRIQHVGTGYDYVQYYLTDEEADFINAYFEDLHFNNYGFKRNKPVIIDYAMSV